MVIGKDSAVVTRHISRDLRLLELDVNIARKLLIDMINLGLTSSFYRDDLEVVNIDLRSRWGLFFIGALRYLDTINTLETRAMYTVPDRAISMNAKHMLQLKGYKNAKHYSETNVRVI